MRLANHERNWSATAEKMNESNTITLSDLPITRGIGRSKVGVVAVKSIPRYCIFL